MMLKFFRRLCLIRKSRLWSAALGEQVGYETLVRKIVKQQVDKSSRFTDWSRRPLTEAQKAYAPGGCDPFAGSL